MSKEQDLDSILQEIAKEYKTDPRNKIFVPENALLASVKEETGSAISKEKFREIVERYMEGELDDNQEEIYNGAVFACSEIARLCFAEDHEDEDEEVDYQISWIENDDKTLSAEVRSI